MLPTRFNTVSVPSEKKLFYLCCFVFFLCFLVDFALLPLQIESVCVTTKIRNARLLMFAQLGSDTVRHRKY